MTTLDTPRTRLALAALGAALALVAGAARADDASSYGFVRTLEGTATLLQGGGERSELEVNAPLLSGDRMWVGHGSRLEAVLPDRSLVRLDADSELALTALAFSVDAEERGTQLRLEQGELQLVVSSDPLGEELPRVDTVNTTLYVQSPGTFLVASDGRDWTEVVVRDGALEVLTPRGSATVRAGEMVEIAGEEAPRVARRSAGGEDGLERWGRELDQEAAAADLRYVDPDLRYAARGLDGNGAWIEVGGRRAWRPRVGSGWRPYWDGYWTPTPAGLTWTSHEPWGWMTYHYGSWDYSPGWGWVWYPGRVFSPAWVYWYWGPSHVGWCPTGYYSSFYANRGFRWGLHGWAGGSWDVFADWTFCGTSYFWRRDLRGHVWSGRDSQHRSRFDVVPRGVITTETRGLRPGLEGRPQDVVEVVRRGRDTRPGSAPGSAPGIAPGIATAELPDVTDFVARRRDLTPEVSRRVLGEAPGEVGRPRSDGSDETPVGVVEPRHRGERPGAVGADPGTGAGGARPDWRDEGRPQRVPVERPSGGAVAGSGAREASGQRPAPAAPRDQNWRDGGRPLRVPVRPQGEDGESAGSARDTGGRPSRSEIEAWRRAAPPVRPSSAPTRRSSGVDGSPSAERPPVVRRVVDGILDGSGRTGAAPRPPRPAEPSAAPYVRPQPAPSRPVVSTPSRPVSSPSRPTASAPQSPPSRSRPSAESASSRRSGGEGNSSARRSSEGRPPRRDRP